MQLRGGRNQDRCRVAQGRGCRRRNRNPAHAAVERELPHALPCNGRVAGDGDVCKRSLGIATAVGALVVGCIAVATTEQAEEGDAGAGQVFRDRNANGTAVIRGGAVIDRTHGDGGAAAVGVVRHRARYQPLRRIWRNVAAVVHRGAQQVATVVVGSRGVLQRIKRGVDRSTRSLHMNAGRSIGCAVNQRQPGHAAESERAVAHRYIGLHHIVDDVAVGDGVTADRIGAAVLINGQRGRGSERRWVVDARYSERQGLGIAQTHDHRADVAMVVAGRG